ncbi:lysophospholipid acyltransferase family protein [Cognatishimia sp. WU-CL00825]
MNMAQSTSFSKNISDYAVNLMARSVFGLFLSLPYETRIRTAGWVFSNIVGPLSGARKRIRKNLAIGWPDMPKDQVEALCRSVPGQFGRSIIEIYSGAEFADRVKDITPLGPGVAHLAKARAENRPIIFVTGHFGGYDVPRSYYLHDGMPIGGLYRDMANPYFNAHYVKAMCTLAEPMFPRDRRGMGKMIKFLKSGGTIALLTDQYNHEGELVTFFGQPTRTAMSAAELALRYDALLMPIYTIRQPDGLSFEVHLEEPIAHSDPVTMMQSYYDSLEKRVRANPDQWLWIHRRWRPERDGAAPTTIDSVV